MQRIKPDATYFTDHSKQNHWCESCYSSTKTTELLDLDDGTKVGKKDLQEFKNDALAEEAWVNCDECSSWVHQICGLFNGRTNNSNAKYTCPRCYVLRAPDVVTRKNSRIGIKGARELPHCKMSEFIEKGLQEALESAYVSRANELKVSYDEIEKADGLSVRVVSNIEKKHVVGEKVSLSRNCCNAADFYIPHFSFSTYSSRC
jgi:PHD-finger